jgi:hypothetical protein
VLRIFGHYYSTAALGLFVCENIVAMLVIYAAFGLAASEATLTSFPGVVLSVAIPGVLNAIMMYSLGLYDRSLMANLWRAAPRLLASFVVCIPVIVACLTFDISILWDGSAALFFFVCLSISI